MKILIRNMVNQLCNKIVSTVLNRLQLSYTHIELGEVDLAEELSPEAQQQLSLALEGYGFELIASRKSLLVEKIRHIVIEMVHYTEEPLTHNFSDHLSRKLHYGYNYLSNIFSEEKGMTIEQFVIAHRIERAKYLLASDEYTLTEIAYKLHYSSVAHLSNQFKKVAGVTPSNFKRMPHKQLLAIEEI